MHLTLKSFVNVLIYRFVCKILLIIIVYKLSAISTRLPLNKLNIEGRIRKQHLLNLSIYKTAKHATFLTTVLTMKNSYLYSLSRRTMGKQLPSSEARWMKQQMIKDTERNNCIFLKTNQLYVGVLQISRFH